MKTNFLSKWLLVKLRFTENEIQRLIVYFGSHMKKIESEKDLQDFPRKIWTQYWLKCHIEGLSMPLDFYDYMQEEYETNHC